MDVIFCVYFDHQNYYFENDLFDRKIVKLYRFPTERKWENFTFDPARIDEMVEFGYRYAKETIEEIGLTGSIEDMYEHILAYDQQNSDQVQRRFTCDTILTNLNRMTSRLTKRKIT